jgi:hypothetical protein
MTSIVLRALYTIAFIKRFSRIQHFILRTVKSDKENAISDVSVGLGTFTCHGQNRRINLTLFRDFPEYIVHVAL